LLQKENPKDERIEGGAIKAKRIRNR